MRKASQNILKTDAKSSDHNDCTNIQSRCRKIIDTITTYNNFGEWFLYEFPIIEQLDIVDGEIFGII